MQNDQRCRRVATLGPLIERYFQSETNKFINKKVQEQKKERDDQPTKTKCERPAKIPMKDGTAASAAAKRSTTKKNTVHERKKYGLHRMLYRY